VAVFQQAVPPYSVVQVLIGPYPSFDPLLQACLQWLTDSSVSAQLADAGYGSLAAAAVQRLQCLAASVHQARSCCTYSPAPYTALATQLQETGQCLSSFAVGATGLQQPRLHQHQQDPGGEPGGRGHHQVLRLPRRALLLQDLSEGAVEAAQARVPGPGCSACSKVSWAAVSESADTVSVGEAAVMVGRLAVRHVGFDCRAVGVMACVC
jgi:hypothetical protein